MITVKKNSLKYKSSDGTMQDAGVLCKIGAIGGDSEILITNLARLDGIFRNAKFEKPIEIILRPVSIYGANINMSNFCDGAANVKTVKIEYDSGELTWILSNAFKNCNELTTVDLGEKIKISSSNASAFSYAGMLEEIKTELDCTSASSVSSMFVRCYKLREVRFTPKSILLSISFIDSSLLSAESIQSIIDGLADLTGGTAQTLTFHADVKAKLTEEQLTSITSKNWTLA